MSIPPIDAKFIPNELISSSSAKRFSCFIGLLCKGAMPCKFADNGGKYCPRVVRSEFGAGMV